MFTDVGFYPKYGFKKLLCSWMLVFTLILVLQKYCVHQFFLYIDIQQTYLHCILQGGHLQNSPYIVNID